MPRDAASAALVKIRATKAAEVCSRFYAPEDVMKLLRPEMSPREFLNTLLKAEQFLAGIDFVAYALPHREAIWWGCLCLQHSCAENLEPWEQIAFKSAVRWVLQPTDANREAAKKPADVLGIATVPGALATAVKQTGGSIAPPGGPHIPPPPYAVAMGVSIAVKVASTKGDTSKMKANQRALLELGIAIAEGRFFVTTGEN